MDYKEFSQKIKTKYPDYSDLSDEELTRKFMTKFPEYSDIDTSKMSVNITEVKPSQSINQPIIPESPKTVGGQLLDFGKKVATAVSPRVMTNPPKNGSASEFGRGLLSTGLDIASLAPRAIVSTMATPLDLVKDSYEKGIIPAVLNQPSRFIENLGVTETPKGAGLAGLVEDVARSPYLPIPGVGSMVPKTAGIIPKIAGGLGDIAVGAGMGTAESVARTGEVNPLGVSLGAVLGSINPVLRGVKGASNWWSDKNVGKNVIEHYQHDLLHGTEEQKVAALQFLKKYTESEQAAARKMNEMVNGFANREGVVLDPSKNISQNVRDQSKWVTPSQPGLLSDEPLLTRWLSPKAPKDFGLLQVGKAVGGPLFWPSLVKDIGVKYPHVAADVTRVIPNETGTIIRNLGNAGYGSQQ